MAVQAIRECRHHSMLRIVYYNVYSYVVGGEGLEPTHLAVLVPKTSAAAITPPAQLRGRRRSRSPSDSSPLHKVSSFGCYLSTSSSKLVGKVGIEPTRLSTTDFESAAAAVTPLPQCTTCSEIL